MIAETKFLVLKRKINEKSQQAVDVVPVIP